MTYQEIYRNGKHIVGMPDHSYDGWFIYAAQSQYAPNAWELYWINHDTEECVEYCRLGDLVNPTKFPYSMHEDPVRGKALCDARFGL